MAFKKITNRQVLSHLEKMTILELLTNINKEDQVGTGCGRKGNSPDRKISGSDQR